MVLVAQVDAAVALEQRLAQLRERETRAPQSQRGSFIVACTVLAARVRCTSVARRYLHPLTLSSLHFWIERPFDSDSDLGKVYLFPRQNMDFHSFTGKDRTALE